MPTFCVVQFIQNRSSVYCLFWVWTLRGMLINFASFLVT